MSREYPDYNFIHTGMSTIDANAYFLKIPLLFGAKWSLSRNTKMYIGAGGHIVYGLFGEVQSDDQTQNLFGPINITERERLYGDGSWEMTVHREYKVEIERLNYGLTASMGIEVSKFSLGLNASANYDHPIMSLSDVFLFSFDIGYRF
jgi:hypothetical protein